MSSKHAGGRRQGGGQFDCWPGRETVALFTGFRLSSAVFGSATVLRRRISSVLGGVRDSAAGLLFLCYSVPTNAADGESGKRLLERNCGRCHAVAAETLSPLKEAPNLWVVLRSFPTERLEFELAEGIGSRHKDMPQIQFSSEDIFKIESYLSGEQ
jgi:cytochrome c